MTPEEKRAYQKGYVAGRKRKNEDRRRAGREAERLAFRRRAFLAALPACVNAQGWTRNDKPITTMEARTALAWDFADEAMRRYY